MLNFSYCVPTKVVFGKDAELQLGAEITALGCKKVLVHYGSGSAKRSGLLDRIFASLQQAGIAYCELGGVQPNPRLSKVREGIALCKEQGVDFVLAVGGGSVIDSSKAICYAMANPDIDVWDIYMLKATPKACMPLGSVLTIAAAGSETSNSSVITDESDNRKRGYNNECCRPKFAIMNPELTYTLPQYQTMCGIIDIMMHTIERYFGKGDHCELTDTLAEGLVRTVMRQAYILHKNPRDYDARAEVMWAGSLSHNALTGLGRMPDFASHQLEHELSGMFDVAHGAGLAAIWPWWARYVYKHDVNRFARFAVNVMGCTPDFTDLEATALAGIAAFERFCHDVEMPTTLAELGIKDPTDAQIAEMAKKCSHDHGRKIGQFVQLDYDDMIKIYNTAK